MKFFLPGLLLLGSVVTPIFFIPFAHHDDYYYFVYDDHSQLGAHPQYSFMMLTGRQLYATLHYPIETFISSIEDLAFERLLTLLIMAISLGAIASLLSRCKLTDLEGLLVAFLIMILPGSTIFLLWASFGLYHLAFALGLFAGILMLPQGDEGLSLRSYDIKKYILAALLLLAAHLIYSPYVSAFFLPPAAAVLFRKRPKSLQLMLQFSALFVFVAASYYILQKYLLLPVCEVLYANNFHQLEQYSFDFNTSVLERLSFVWKIALPQSLAMWTMDTTVWPLFIPVAVNTAIQLAKRSKPGAAPPLGFLPTAIALLCVLSPLIAAKGSHSSFRVLFVFTSMLLLFSLAHWFHLLTMFASKRIAFLLILIAAAVSAGHLVQQQLIAHASGAHRELAVVSSFLSTTPQLQGYRIKAPAFGTSLVCRQPQGADEFFFASSQFPQDLAPMMRAALLERGIPGKRLQISTNSEAWFDPAKLKRVFIKIRSIDNKKLILAKDDVQINLAQAIQPDCP